VLRATYVLAGFIVPRLCQRGHGQNGRILNVFDFVGAPDHFLLQIGSLVQQEVAGSFEFELCRNTRQHNRRADGFANVVKRAQMETPLLIFRLRFGCQKNDWNVLGQWLCFETTANFITIRDRHHDIQKNEVRKSRHGYIQNMVC
jgi:hypothetical protein